MLYQAIKAARDFQKQTKILTVMKNRDAWTELNNQEKNFAYGSALKAEGLLCAALSTARVPAPAPASMKWAKDVTRDVLGEIASNAKLEEICHPVVIQEARKLIG